MIEEVTEDYENKMKENKMLKKELATSKAEVERLNDAMNKIQLLASIKANRCLGCASCEEEAHRALNKTDK